MKSLLIRNGKIITADNEFVANIYIEQGVIKSIGEGLSHSAEKEIDAADHLIFPGAVDAHVHLDLPVMGTVSADSFETGTIAGMCGGTTTIVDFVTPERNQSLVDALNQRKKIADKSVVDYGLHMSVTGFGEKTAFEMEECVKKEGISSFKAYLAYKESIGLEDKDLIQVMKVAKSLGVMVTVHCEHGDLVNELRDGLCSEGKTGPKFHAVSRPSLVEGEATGRSLVMAEMMGSPIYIVHVSCQEAVEAIAKMQDLGSAVFAETCPQYLLLDESVYKSSDLKAAGYVMSPPLRPKEHQDVLWKALEDGRIQVVATDHCPFNLKGHKEAGLDDFRLIPNGAPGIEHRLSLMYTHGVLKNRISLNKFVELVSTRPAQLFGMYPRKGEIVAGADADLVIWNPTAKRTISAETHHHNCDYSIFEGFQTTGAPTWVIVNGKICYDEGDILVEPGAGRYIPRSLPHF